MGNFSEIFKTWEGKKTSSKPTDSWANHLEKYLECDPSKDQERDSDIKEDRSYRQRYPIQDRIDLHGKTKEEALRCLKAFLIQSQAQGLKKIAVVHGKGHHSKDKSVIGPAVIEFLRRDPGIMDFDYCPREEGGRGATWVWIIVPGK